MNKITAKELKEKYGIHRPELYYLQKGGAIKVEKVFENGRAKNYYDLDEVLALRKNRDCQMKKDMELYSLEDQICDLSTAMTFLRKEGTTLSLGKIHHLVLQIEEIMAMAKNLESQVSLK